jgi:diadenosine tetraphosphate (Ap4A) HIT family hydrolase
VEDVILQNDLAYARFDRYPVTPGHLLLIPRRHVASYFDCTEEEMRALWALVEAGRRVLIARYAPDGFNVGINVGEAAGQTVMHVHVHLIPRYQGDVPNPRGGVRGVIPERQSYP